MTTYRTVSIDGLDIFYGVEVTTVQYNGMIHDFGLLNGLAELPETRSLFVQAAAQLKKHLQ